MNRFDGPLMKIVHRFPCVKHSRLDKKKPKNLHDHDLSERSTQEASATISKSSMAVNIVTTGLDSKDEIVLATTFGNGGGTTYVFTTYGRQKVIDDFCKALDNAEEITGFNFKFILKFITGKFNIERERIIGWESKAFDLFEAFKDKFGECATCSLDSLFKANGMPGRKITGQRYAIMATQITQNNQIMDDLIENSLLDSRGLYRLVLMASSDSGITVKFMGGCITETYRRKLTSARCLYG